MLDEAQHKLIPQEHLLERPMRICQIVDVRNAQSFIEYFSIHAGENSAIFYDP